MFNVDALALSIHVLIAGLWLGAEIGILLWAGRLHVGDTPARSARADLRTIALMDLVPRTAMAAMFGLGVYLTYDLAFGFRYGGWRAAAFVAIAGSVAWLALTWYLFWVDNSADGRSRDAVHVRYAHFLARVDIAWSVAVVVFLAVGGVGTLQSNEPALLDVLGWKMLLFGVIVVGSVAQRVVLRRAFDHARSAFGRSPIDEELVYPVLAPVRPLAAAVSLLLFVTAWASVSSL